MIINNSTLVASPISARKARELMNKECVPTKNDTIVLVRLLDKINKEIKEAASAGKDHISFEFNCVYAETIDISPSSAEYITNRARQILVDLGYEVNSHKRSDILLSHYKVIGFNVNYEISWKGAV